MTYITQLRRLQPRLMLQRRWSISAAALTSIVILPTLVLAHGGMGPDELGPPIMTAGLIGFIGYWAVMLFWPTPKEDPTIGVQGQYSSTPSTERRSHKRSARVKRIPRLRKIEGTGHFNSDHQIRRKASDG